jgi:hypothetical protein
MAKMRRAEELTLEEARHLAARLDRQQEEWDELADPNSWGNAVAAHYRHLSASDVTRLWEAGVNEKGEPPTRFELAALVERWCEVFGCLPPSEPGHGKLTAQPYRGRATAGRPRHHDPCRRCSQA